MTNNHHQLLKLTTTAVMVALTCVLTMVVRIPSPTKGYINLGDCAVLVSGWLLGPVYGPVAGGVGSALADLLSGYPVYIPGTLIIKAGMALIISLVPDRLGKNGTHLRFGFIAGAAAAETVMVLGYCLYAAAIVGKGFLPALTGVPGNVVQGIAGAAGACFLTKSLSHTEIARVYRIRGFAEGRAK